jgi:hypothetical protein
MAGSASTAGVAGGDSTSNGDIHHGAAESSEGEGEERPPRRRPSAPPALQAPLPIVSDEKLELLREAVGGDGDTTAPAPAASGRGGRFGLLSELLLSILVRDPLSRPSVQRASRLVDAAAGAADRAVR